jgi:hypothetical protein
LPLTVLLDRATRGLQLDLSKHIFIARHRESTHGLVLLFARSPLGQDEIARGLRFVADAGFELVYAPGVPAGAGNEVARFLAQGDRDRFVREHRGDIVPETDDKPFYFRASKWTALLGSYTGGRGNLLIILGIAILFAVGLLLVPIAIVAPAAARRNWRLLALFGCIGLGYITLELGLMVQFVLLLGHPVRALSVILFSLLLSSGVGSYVSQRFSARARVGDRWATWPLIGVVATACVYAFLLKPALGAAMGLGVSARILIAVALVMPLGFLMGTPLPAAMVRLKTAQEDLVLWAWGINGTCSVVGSTACILIAHATGYRSVILVAAGCYALAWYLLRGTLRRA